MISKFEYGIYIFVFILSDTMKKPTQTDCLKYVIRNAILEGVRKTLIFAAYSFQWIELKRYIKSICKGLSVKVVILRNYINKPYGIQIIPA